MSANPREDLLELCRDLRARLGSRGSFRLRCLLDMVLLELERQPANPGRTEATADQTPENRPDGLNVPER